jgi:hypothetical protein
VISRLRAAHEAERLSLETFVDRVDVAYAATSRDELAETVADLPDTGLVARAVVTTAAALSRWTALYQVAWRRARLPRLVLPEAEGAIVGRSHACDRVVADPTVSRVHARLRARGRRWWLTDLGSTNGTWVNGRRVIDETEVRPGDEVALGEVAFRAGRPPRTMGRDARVAGPYSPRRP